jgi:predicted O-methyltransferase YrrM
MHNLECLYGPFLSFTPNQFQTQTKVFDFVFIDAQKSEYPNYIDYLIDNKLIDDKTILLFDDVIKYQDKII